MEERCRKCKVVTAQYAKETRLNESYLCETCEKNLNTWFDSIWDELKYEIEKSQDEFWEKHEKESQ